MSRLDSFLRRLTAQRDTLNHIAAAPALPDGPVIELGLGNGRTFDHLRACFPDRRIIAFDRDLRAYGPSTPPPEDLVLGEIAKTARAFCDNRAALVHADIGTGYDDIDSITLTWLPALAAGLLQPGGIAASGLPLVHPDLLSLPLPPGVGEGRYFLYRRSRNLPVPD